MTELLQALRSEFNAEPAPPQHPKGLLTVQAATRDLNHALGQLRLFARAGELTAEQAKLARAAAASLHRSATTLETLATGIEDHVANGVSVWVGPEGKETPSLL